ncbi:hypothetical protein [Streptomyces sp. G-5]|uniref:hypothetical protein n=1 Tax=Streptomyces sp. G-5 TaxID=2977231 RepID=UPI0021D2DE1D|nr:hypothetical protein [Streptomyces sp. G-5]MCU4750280.1 hypothetical protein [Streptomyces sp. G-5]
MDTTPPPGADQVGARTREDIETLVRRLHELWRRHPRLRNDHTQGVVDTALWALGRAPAPVSGTQAEAGPQALRDEDDRAHALIYDPAAWGGRPIRRDWAVGVQHTAMWLRGATDDRPAPFA